MEKTDLSDVSIIIPIKIDHQNRTENLKTIINFIKKYFVNYETFCKQ
jgi:hypothetical protein